MIVEDATRMLRTDEETVEAERAQLLPWNGNVETSLCSGDSIGNHLPPFPIGSEADHDGPFA